MIKVKSGLVDPLALITSFNPYLSDLPVRMTTGSARTPHPYYPRDLVLDHYVPNTNSVVKSLGHVLIAFSTIVCLTTALVRPKRHTTLQHLEDRLTFFWFILCGLIHTLFEGYFGIHHATLAGDQSPVGQVWKEYALSDSRYLTSDSFVLVVERITTVSAVVHACVCVCVCRKNKGFPIASVLTTTGPSSQACLGSIGFL